MPSLEDLLIHLQKIDKAGGSVTLSIDHFYATSIGLPNVKYAYCARTTIKDGSYSARGLDVEDACGKLLVKIKVKYP